MATKIISKTIGDRMIVETPYHLIEWDLRMTEKKYPFAIGLYNEKFTDEIIDEIESSKIVKVDTDLCYYSQPSHASTLFLVPQPMFDVTKFTEVIYSLLQKLAQQIEEP